MGPPPVGPLPAGLPPANPFSFGPPHFSGAFGSQTLGPYLPNNTPLFSPTPTHNSDRLTPLHNNNNRGFASPTPSSPISWSPSPPPPPQVPRPEAAEPNFASTSRDRNEKNRRGGRGRRGSHAGRANTRGGRSTKESGRNSPREDPEVEGSQSRQKGRNRGMTPQEKLFLIRECCAHSDKYKPRNKLAFWETI